MCSWILPMDKSSFKQRLCDYQGGRAHGPGYWEIHIE